MMSTDEFDFRAHRLQATESTMHCYVLLFFPSPCQQASLIWAHSICQNLHWKQPMHVHSDITWRNLIEVENPWACLKLTTACMRVAAASIQCGGAGAAHGLSESQLDSFCQRKHPAESCLFIEDRLAVWFRTARWKDTLQVLWYFATSCLSDLLWISLIGSFRCAPKACWFLKNPWKDCQRLSACVSPLYFFHGV